MNLRFRKDRTATGKLELVAIGECTWDEFPKRAETVVNHFGMDVVNKSDGLDERLWITRIGRSKFCVSWDIWLPEVSIIAWEDTPDTAIEQLAAIQRTT